MMATLAHRRNAVLPVLAVAVFLLGAVAARQPFLALGLLAASVVFVIGFRAPVANLTLLVFFTAIVPKAIQNRFGFPPGTAGLIFSDLLLLTGFVWVAPLIVGERFDARRRNMVLVVVGFLIAVAVQFARGVSEGHDVSVAGTELRTLMGFGTFLVALPIVSDERLRERLMKALVFPGLALGLWGLAQWALQIEFAGEFGVRAGVSFTTSGRGQLQGGLFAYPVAIVLAFAALISSRALHKGARPMLLAIVLLNLVCVLLTYERAFWIGTLIGVGFVVLRAEPVSRARAIAAAPVVVALAAISLSLITPGTLVAARERLLSLRDYDKDHSVRYRLVESRHVLEKIKAEPVTGAGLGATIFWGRADEGVPAESFDYSHNAYLWLAWKLGIPVAAVVLLAFAAAVTWRSPSRDEPLFSAFRNASQASLLLLLIVSLAFPSFNSYGITATMGVLLAVCCAPAAASAGAASKGATERSPHRLTAV